MQTKIQELLDLSANSSAEDYAAGRVRADDVKILHKYADPLEADLNLELGGTRTAACPLGAGLVYDGSI